MNDYVKLSLSLFEYVDFLKVFEIIENILKNFVMKKSCKESELYENKTHDVKTLKGLLNKKIQILNSRCNEMYSDYERPESIYQKHPEDFCFHFCIQEILKLLEIDENFGYSDFLDLLQKFNNTDVINEKGHVHIILVDYILRNYGLKLRCCSEHVRKSLCSFGKKNFIDYLKIQDRAFYLIHYKEHYMLFSKIYNNFHWLSSDYEISMSFDFSEFLEFILNVEVTMFKLEKYLVDDEYDILAE